MTQTFLKSIQVKRVILFNVSFLTIIISSVLAQMPQVLKDINNPTTLNSTTTTGYNFFGMNGDVFFAADDGINGNELWKTDGTVAGTVMVKDINPGSTSSNPLNFTLVNGTLFFTATTAANGLELWKTDGTEAGTEMVKDIIVGTTGGAPSNLTEVNGQLFFAATLTGQGRELWKSDGTNVGTIQVKDINAGSVSSSPANLINVNGLLFFTALSAGNGIELWKSDGSEAGTTMVRDITAGSGGSSLSGFKVFGNSLIFTYQDPVVGAEPWISDGSTAGTVMIKDVNPGAGGSVTSLFTVVGNLFYYASNDGSNGTELWVSDGTAVGTVLLKDINPGISSSSPTNLTAVGNILYFSATDDIAGNELWKTDGTSNGTILVKDIYPGILGSGSLLLTNLNGTLFFRASNGVNGLELWKSDGTETGTVMVKDVNAGFTSTSPANFTVVNNQLYFTGNLSSANTLFTSDGTEAGTVALNTAVISGGSFATLYGFGNKLFFMYSGIPSTDPSTATGREPWVSDGTNAGTKLIKDINATTSAGNPGPYCKVGNTVYFAADDGINGFELWKTDGTASGTVLVKDISTGASSSLPRNLVNVNGTLFFTAAQPGFGAELWKSDGTEQGTIMVKDINPGNAAGIPTFLTDVNGTLFFVAVTVAEGSALWKSDGTEAGTVMVADIISGASPSPNFQNLTNVNGTLFFTATVAPFGTELWKSDGSQAGTVLVKDIVVGTGSPGIDDVIAYNGKLYFSANDGLNGNEPWVSDGTNAGTQMFVNIGTSASFPNSNPTNFSVAAGKLYFSAFLAGSQFEPWVSDGTPQGTYMITEVVPGGSGSTPFGFTEMNGYVYFNANGPGTGRELWRTDNTAAGTTLVKDIITGTGSSGPELLTAVNNTLYFRATTAGGGVEFFKSDGTEAGTVSYDLYPGATTSNPDFLTAFNDMLLFTATDPVSGRELWKAVSASIPSSSFSIVGDTTVCVGNTVNYTAVNVVGQNISYNWSLPDGGGTLSTNNNVATVTWTSVGNRNIELSLTNTAGTTLPKQLLVNVITGGTPPTQSPVITDFARTLTASNFPNGTTCQWFRNDVAIVGANQPSYYAALDGTYTAKFVSTCATGPASNAITFSTSAIPQTITLNPIPNTPLTSNLKIKLNGSSSSNLPLFFQKVSGPGFIQNDTLYVTGAGTLVGDILIRALQPGNEIYSPATEVLQSIRILRGDQSIAFDSIPNMIFGPQLFTLTANATSGLAVTYSIINGTNAASIVSGNKLKLNGAGTITVRASQPGNVNYLGATAVERTFCVGVRNLQAISGDVNPCLNTYRYNAQRIPGAVYNWTLSGGGVLTTNQDTAWVLWQTPGNHTLKVKVNSACDTIYSNEVELNISTSNDAPSPVSGMIPVNNAVDQQLPLRLSWIPGTGSTKYDLYVWNAADPQPVTPYAANLEDIFYTLPLNSLQNNTTYKWRIVSKNPCTAVSGPVQEFNIIPLPDLVVSNVQAPPTATSGQTITVSWQVTNVGPGSTLPNATWSEGVYFSLDTVPFVSFSGSPNWNPTSWGSLTANGRPLLLGKKVRPTGLASGQSYTNSLNFTLPLNYSFPVYIYVITDNDNSNYKIMQVSVANDTARKATPMQINLAPTPDLRVDSVFTPNSTFSGSTVNITYKVRNYGVLTPAGGSWVDSIFLSPNPLFDRSNAIPLNAPKANGSYYPNANARTVLNTTQLLSDSSYTRSVSAVIPNKIFGTWFVYVKTNAIPSGNSSIYEGALADNNLGQAVIQVYLTPTPKLTVNNLNVPVTSASTTQPIGVSWNIKNEGFRDNIEFNRGHIIRNGSCGVQCAPTAPPGAVCTARSVEEDIITYGSSYWLDRVYLSTDPGGLNIANAILVKQTAHGEEFSGVYFDPINGSYVSCPALVEGNVNLKNVIDPNKVFPKSEGFNIPSNLLPGSYYVYVYTNPTKTVFEYPGTAQIARSAIPIVIQRPDVTVAAFTAPAAATGGQTVVLNYTVSNNGPGNVFNHLRRDRIFISNSSSFDASAQLLGTNTFAENILTSDPVSHTFNYNIPPATSGTKYFYVVTNFDSTFKETNYVNNLSAPAAINISAAIPADFVVTSVQTSDTVFSIFSEKIIYRVTNNGSGLASGSWTDSLFISCNAGFNTATSFFVGKRTQSRTVAASGGSYTDTFNIAFKYSFNINDCFPPIGNSNAYFFVKTNADTSIYEGSAINNNVGSSGNRPLTNPLVDHIVTNVTGPDTTTVGTLYPLNWRIKNIGYNPYSAQLYNSWFDGIFFSTDSLVDLGDIKAGEYLNYIKLERNQDSGFRKTPLIPFMPTGDYYVYVNNNFTDRIPGEKVLSNNINFIRNTSGAAKKIHVIQPNMADLTDTIVSAPSEVALGQPITIVYKITNIGSGTTFPGSNWQNRILLSANTLVVSNDGDRLLSTRNRYSVLTAGQSYLDTVTVTIPTSTVPGNYFLISQANSNNAVLESSLTNNLGLSQINVFAPPNTDLIVSNVLVPDTVTLGYTIDTAKWVVSNVSGEQARGFTKDGIYLSAANEFDSTAILQGIKDKNILMQPNQSDTVRMAPLVTGVIEGNYNVFVKTDVLNNILESDKDNNVGMAASKVYVKVKELPLNVNEPNSLQRISRYYKLLIPDSLIGSTIMVTLTTPDSLSRNNEMFIGAGYIPTAADYDYRFETPNYGNQRIVITDVNAPVYYIMYRCVNVNPPIQNVQLKAVKLPFAILNVNSNAGGNIGNVTIRIRGSLFVQGMTAKLSNGATSISSSAVYYTNSTQVFATFPLQGKPIGIYDVTLIKPDSSEAVAPQSFSIVPANNGGLITGGGNNTGAGNGNEPGCDPGAASGLNSQLVLDLVVPSRVLTNRPVVLQINFSNPTNFDIPVQSRILYSEEDVKMAFNIADVPNGTTSLYIEFTEPGGPPGIIRPGGSGTITIHCRSPRDRPADGSVLFKLK